MNWLTNFVRPKITAMMRRTEVPDNLWTKCPSCDHMLFHRDLEANLNVCHHCNQHMRLKIQQRLELLFDNGSFTKVPTPKVITDPLKFKDTKRYSDRLKEYRAKTGNEDAITLAYGQINGNPIVIAAFDFNFMVALGSAMAISPSIANEADTPPVVGSVSSVI